MATLRHQMELTALTSDKANALSGANLAITMLLASFLHRVNAAACAMATTAGATVEAAESAPLKDPLHLTKCALRDVECQQDQMDTQSISTSVI